MIRVAASVGPKSVQEIWFMEAPRRYSASPFYSFVTVPTPVYYAPPFPEMLNFVARWLTGRQPQSSARDRQFGAG
jgi:hypothetical protein